MDDDVSIRLIDRSNADEVAAAIGVWHRAGREAYADIPQWRTLTRDDATQVFQERILTRCDVWVAVNAGVIVGVLAMAGSYIDRLYVEPRCQRQGWGRRLLNHAKARHPSGLSLHTHQSNRPARAFYERAGFVAVGFGISPPPESLPDVEYRWAAGGEAPGD